MSVEPGQTQDAIERRKLTVMRLSVLHEHPFLKHFKTVFLFALMARLGFQSDLTVVDMATSTTPLTIPPAFDAHQRRSEMQRVAEATRSDLILSGTIRGVGEADDLRGVRLGLDVFDAATGHVFELEPLTFTELPPAGQPMQVPMPAFETMVSQALRLVLDAVYGVSIGERLFETLCRIDLGHSFQALAYLVQAQRAGSAVEKLGFLQGAIKADPAMEMAHAQLGKLYRSEKHFEQSVLAYRKAVEVSRSPGLVKAQYANEAGIGCAMINKPQVAIQWWQRAVQYDPAYINPYFNLANTHEDLNELDQAARYLVKAQRLSPSDFRTFFNLARVYSKRGDWQKALSQYQQQLASDDQDPWCHSDIATCYLNLGDVEAAKTHLEKTLSLDPRGEAGDYAKLILMGFHTLGETGT
ncbi:MAG: tetratricopeptide repeat protein [Candidatus Melainabacteria bacterium]